MRRPHHGGNLAWAATVAGCPPYLVKDFSASINPWGIPETVVNAIAEDIPRLIAYPNPDYPRLRNCLAKELGIGAEYILPGNGSAELLTWAAKDLAQQKATYLIVPAFGDYQRALRAFGANIQPLSAELPFGNLDRLIGDQVSDRERFESAGLILNNPHNPTGKLWRKQEITSYLKHFALVVIDEAFMDFLPPSDQQTLVELVPHFPNLVILRSLTKFYSLPGLRIGYAVASPERLEQWQSLRDPWSVNSLAATAAVVALKDLDFQQHTWNWLPPARQELEQGLSEILELEPFPSAVNFLLVKSAISVSQLQIELLQRYQIYIRDCLSFPELGDRYFRIAIRTPAENRSLLEALSKITTQLTPN